jgi:hypothetical protein
MEARVCKLVKERVHSDVSLKRVVAFRECDIKVIDNMVSEDLIFQLRTFLTASDPKTEVIFSNMYCGATPVQTCWNIFKLAVKLIPGLPKSWQRKIDIEFDERSRDYKTAHITRHLCPHYSFKGEQKHLRFLMGVDDSSEDI